VISINEYITAGVITKILTINSADIDKSFIWISLFQDWHVQ
jgi:hypothetical protein